MRSYLIAAALLLAPVSVARAQDCARPGHWETRREVVEAPGHWEMRSRNVWRAPHYETEVRTRTLAGRWEIDFAGNRIWIAGPTVTESVQVLRPGYWETIQEKVWIAGARTFAERQVWVADPCAPARGPWDDAPRARPCTTSVSVEIGPALEPTCEHRRECAPVACERKLEPVLPTCEHDPWPQPTANPYYVPAPRPAKPLVLVEAPACPAPATVVVTAPAPCTPAPRVVYVADPCPPATVVIERRPCAPVIVAPRFYEPRHEYRHWDEPRHFHEPVRVGFGVGVGLGVRVGATVHASAHVSVGGHHHR
jgi:hypothetical protein